MPLLLRCPVCDTRLDDGACPACGFVTPLRPPPGPPGVGPAVAGLIVNLVVLPGAGSLIGRRSDEGLWQLILALLGLLLWVATTGPLPGLLGTVLLLSAWGWGLLTGLQMVLAAMPPAAPTHRNA